MEFKWCWRSQGHCRGSQGKYCLDWTWSSMDSPAVVVLVLFIVSTSSKSSSTLFCRFSSISSINWCVYAGRDGELCQIYRSTQLLNSHGGMTATQPQRIFVPCIIYFQFCLLGFVPNRILKCWKKRTKTKNTMLNWFRTSIISEWLENRNFESQVSVILDGRDSWATGKDKARSHTKGFLNLPDKKKKKKKKERENKNKPTGG